MWWKWISTASAGQGLATVPRVLPHTQHPHLLQKSYQSKNTKKEVANCPAFTHFLSFPSKGWEYSLSYSGFTAIRLWLLTISSRDLLGGTCLLEWEQWELSEATLEFNRKDSSHEPQLLLHPPETGFCSSDHCRHVLHYETSRKHLLCPTGTIVEVTHQPYSSSEHTDHIH